MRREVGGGSGLEALFWCKGAWTIQSSHNESGRGKTPSLDKTPRVQTYLKPSSNQLGAKDRNRGTREEETE